MYLLIGEHNTREPPWFLLVTSPSWHLLVASPCRYLLAASLSKYLVVAGALVVLTGSERAYWYCSCYLLVLNPSWYLLVANVLTGAALGTYWY